MIQVELLYSDTEDGMGGKYDIYAVHSGTDKPFFAEVSHWKEYDSFNSFHNIAPYSCRDFRFEGLSVERLRSALHRYSHRISCEGRDMRLFLSKFRRACRIEAMARKRLRRSLGCVGF